MNGIKQPPKYVNIQQVKVQLAAATNLPVTAFTALTKYKYITLLIKFVRLACKCSVTNTIHIILLKTVEVIIENCDCNTVTLQSTIN